MTQEQAYLAMYCFLEKQWSLGLNDLPALLGSMSLLADGSPVDSALLIDWNEAVAAAVAGRVDASLVLKK